MAYVGDDSDVRARVSRAVDMAWDGSGSPSSRLIATDALVTTAEDTVLQPLADACGIVTTTDAARKAAVADRLAATPAPPTSSSGRHRNRPSLTQKRTHSSGDCSARWNRNAFGSGGTTPLGFRNAVDHAGPGVAIEIGPRTEAGGHGISVADDGPGVPPEVCVALFDPGFSTADSSDIGLAIVDRIVDAHD